MQGACETPSTAADALANHESRALRSSFIALVPCFAATVLFGLLSDGSHHDDDLAHFLMARWVRWYPEYLLHIWARPGLTWPLASVAWIGDSDTGWHACRVLSAVATAGGAFMAATLAHRYNVRRPWLVVLACYLQPFNSLLAFTTLTENFAGLYLVGALLLLESRRERLASLVFSLVLITRHEAVVLLPIWWIALAARPIPVRHRASAMILALWAPIAHNVAFHASFGNWPVSLLFLPSGSTEYTAAGPLTYIPRALAAIPPVMAGLALLGSVQLVRDNRRPAVAIAGVYFAMHCMITALGLFASGGFSRFMVTIAPIVAILSVAGWNEFSERARTGKRLQSAWLTIGAVWIVGLVAFEFERRAGRIGDIDSQMRVVLIVATGVVVTASLAMTALSRRIALSRAHRPVLVVLGSTVLIQLVWILRPLRIGPRQRLVQSAIAWMRGEHLDKRPIFATDPWFSYFLGHVEDPAIHKGPRLLAAMPVGTIVAWDSVYSESDFHGVSLAQLARDGHYQKRRSFAESNGQDRRIEVFEKMSKTPVPDAPENSYPPDLMATRDAAVQAYYQNEVK